MGLVAVAIVIAVAPVGSRSGHFWVFFANYRGLAKKLVQIAAELYTGSRRV